MNWWNNAQVRIATMKPLHRHQVYDTSDGYKVELPKNFYKPRMILLPDKTQLLRLDIEQVFYTPGAIGFSIYENDLVIIGTQPPRWMLAYDAIYPKVLDEESHIETPVWADEACAIYSAMQAITREMIADARYRKFLGKQDAGNPQQSPFLPVAKWLEERFNHIVNTHSDDDKDFR